MKKEPKTKTAVKPKEELETVATEEAKDISAKAKKTAKEKPERYIEAVGRRKKAVARVRMYTRKQGITVNDKTVEQYFAVERFRKEVLKPFEVMKITDKLGVSAKVSGGGIMAQAEAVRHGISRALVKFNPLFKKRLHRLNFLTRDDRMVERKKYGKKKARKSPQWSKR